MSEALERYDTVAIFLHWMTALLIIGMIVLGLTMEDFPMSLRFQAINLHKSIGICILALSVFRLIWRLMNPAPPLPADMQLWERWAAHLSHWALYAFIIIMPLSGWLMVSANPKYPIVFFGLGEAPFIPMPDAPHAKLIGGLAHETHELLGYGAIVLILVHAAAALRHHFINGDAVLVRMLPRFLLRRERIVL